MLYEVRVAADSDQEFADTLGKIIEAIRGIPANGNVLSFGRYRDPDAIVQLPVSTNGGLPLTQEAFTVAAKASQDNAAPAPAPAPAPAKRGRPAKGTATVVAGPDGEPAAAMEESPFGNAPPDPDDQAAPLTAAQKRDKAIAILQSVFADAAGPPGVRALQTKLKVKKFSEVPDAQCDELLTASEQLYARVKAAAA
jgi:hypothetical protein